MFRKQPEEQFQVLPIDSIITKGGRYYRVHDYGIVEIQPPQELPTPEVSDETTEEA